MNSVGCKGCVYSLYYGIHMAYNDIHVAYTMITFTTFYLIHANKRIIFIYV